MASGGPAQPRLRPPLPMEGEAFEKLPVIICHGSTPAEVGRSHGEQLRRRIAANLGFYFGLFQELGWSSEKVRAWGVRVQGEIGGFSPELAEEISGIAEGAGRDLWELFALNARSELLAFALAGRQPPAECTAVYCAASACLAQNWDWDARIDCLPVLLQIPRCGSMPQILTMTEPGMVAKVGLNDSGLGVCLNILAGPAPSTEPCGLPVHCLLRLALSCTSLRNAEAMLKAAPRHCNCHILLADATGQFRLLEFAGPDLERAAADPLASNISDESPIEGAEWQVMPPTVVAHTNHYLHPRFANFASSLAHTRERYDRVMQIAEDHDANADSGPLRTDAQLDLVKRILGDREGAPRSILYDDAAGLSRESPIATVCSIVMELRTLQMHVTRGSAMEQKYTQVPLLASSL